MAILYALVARWIMVFLEFSVVSENTGIVAYHILVRLLAKADSRLFFLAGSLHISHTQSQWARVVLHGQRHLRKVDPIFIP